MRAARIAAIACVLGGCDRVFGIGDPYQDAATVDADVDAEPDARSEYRRTITITQPTPTALTSFPISVVLAADAQLQAHVLDGTDIGFVDSSGDALPCEVVRYDASTGTLDAWVLVPELPASPTPLSIDLVYGVPRTACARTQVWPGHLGVWHAELSIERTSDSSSHGHELTRMTPTSVPQVGEGIVGNSLSFDGSDDELCDTVDADGSLAVGTSSFSYSAWVNVGTSVGNFDAPFQKGGAFGHVGFGIYLGDDTWDAFDNDSLTEAQLITAFSPQRLDSWRYLAVVVDRASGTVQTYLDGSPAGVSPLGDLMSMTTTDPLCMGSSIYPYRGNIDEARIYSTAVSREWIEASYVNLAVRTQMIVVGPER